MALAATAAPPPPTAAQKADGQEKDKKAEKEVKGFEEIDPATYAQAFREFEASSVTRQETSVDGARVVTFDLPEGLTLTMVDPATGAPAPADGAVQEAVEGDFTTQISAGYGGYQNRIWIGFNQYDQNVLSNAVATAVITAAICAIPGIGWAACAVAGLAVSVAVAYINRNGVCSGNRTLYYYSVRSGGALRCSYSPPPAFY